MGEPACGLLEAELALDRLEAQLAAELPGHVRAFARAHAEGAPPPPAPPIAHRAASLTAARNALAHPLLADRGLALLRVLAPIAIETDPAVVAARAADATWQALARLTAAREAAARARFGRGFLDVTHRLHGSIAIAGPAPWPAPIAGWHDHSPPVPVTAVTATAELLAERHGARGSIQIVPSASARPRAFVVEPGREVIVVVPDSLDTPAARFAALHELGHALVGLLASAEPPRSVDEAGAAYVARLIEDPAHRWHDPLAVAARHRRTALARALDAVERGAYDGAVPVEHPPWALWHDPGAQAAYVTAEQLADRWWAELGPAPAPGALARAITDERASIDRATQL